MGKNAQRRRLAKQASRVPGAKPPVPAAPVPVTDENVIALLKQDRGEEAVA